MHLNRNWRWVLLLVAGTLISGHLCGCVRRSPPLDLPQARVGENGGLPDGIYATLSEADTSAAADDVSQPHEVLEYDGRHIGESRPVTYVAVGLQQYVPFQFSRPPELTHCDDEFASLHVTLESKSARGLEDFTTRYSRVAVIIDGKVVTIHKVREPIRGGRVQISRCADDACQVLFSKLTD